MSQFGDESATPDPVLRAVVERYDERPDKCTIYPSESEGVERMSTWITASEGSFVDPQTMR